MKIGIFLKTGKIVGLFLLLIFFSKSLFAQDPWVLDPNFGVNGITRIDFGPSYVDTPNDLLVLPGGKILTAGISVNSAENYIALSQLLPNGQPDLTGFGTDGQVLLHFVLRDQVNAMAIQDDEKIVAVGTQASSNAGSAITPSIYRFNSNGSLDTTFADSGSLAIRFDAVSSGQFYSVKILPDKKIIAVGNSTGNANGGVFGFGVMRFLPDGELDASFGANGKSVINIDGSYHPVACAFLSDTAMVMVTVTFTNGLSQFVLAMMDSSGNPIPVFGNNGVVLTGIEGISGFSGGESLAITSDGKIMLAATTTASFQSRFSVFRFLSNGSIDSTFGTNGRTDIQFSAEDLCYDMKIDENGKILLVGSALGVIGLIPALARLNEDGTLDTAFAPGGKFTIDLNNNSGNHYLSNFLLLQNGDILAAGYDGTTNSGDFMITKLTQNPTSVDDDKFNQPDDFVLSQNFPNPFNPATTIRYSIPIQSRVTIKVFDILGKEINTLIDEEKEQGVYTVRFDTSNLSSGIYFYKLQSGSFVETKKMILMK